jgi:hypothetical protein
MATCFVIMPFGDKTDAEGNTIKFDEIYEYVIKRSLDDIKNLKCVRCDESDVMRLRKPA